MKRTLAGVAVTLCLEMTGAVARPDAPLTIDPAMTKGPATAPVTIVEFSDYQ
jgi:protein-disulfide isomerase